MLDVEKNRLLTEIGPNTRMGDLMRRYWHPIAAIAELDDAPVKPVRLLGEDLVLFKDLSGGYGLIDRHCQHRRADLSYGYVETHGLRCNYHGWVYGADGACLEQPFDDTDHPNSRFREKIHIKAYPVEAHAGLLFAYLGPAPAPLVPNWEPFTWRHGFVQVVFSEVPCNWLQCQENSIDPVHFEWMHDNWGKRLKNAPGPYAPKHLKIDFEEFDYGIVYRRIREGADETHPLWTVGRVCLWPNMLFTGNHFEWRVPVDDTTTLSVGWFFSRAPKEREPYVQNRIPYWYAPVKDQKTGKWITSHVMNQDFVAWVGQGGVADRTRENLGRSDRGIVLLRQIFLADLDRIEHGQDPKAVIRDPAVNQCVTLPIAAREHFTEGWSLKDADKLGSNLAPSAMKRFIWLTGQPEEIGRAHNEAMGLE